MEKEKNYPVITVGQILQVTGGKLVTGDEKLVCEDFSRDTREIKGGEVYIGLVGDVSNGGIYYEEALKNGASAVIVQDIEISEEKKKQYKDKTIIVVEDTLKALQEIAKLKRSLYPKDFPIIAVTGSVGKTSTKDMVASVVSQKYKTLKTSGNYNNHIGVPLTILRLKDEEAAVVEMGMNHKGEISILTNIAKPTLCVITNIGTSHIGNLGSRENILKAKLEILEGNDKKEIVINNDNDMLNKFYKEENEKYNIITYGIEEKSEIYATDIKQEEERSTFTCHIGNEKFEVTVPVGGLHFVYNALCAISVGNKLGLTKEEIKRGIETFELTAKRSDIEKLKDGTKIINETYNASFESMKAGIESLAQYKNRKIAVLGDMLELGEYTEELHKKVGEEVAKNKIDILICAGESAKFIVEQAKKCGMNEKNIYYFENKEDIVNLIEKIKTGNDVILFKASNRMGFFKLVEELKNKSK